MQKYFLTGGFASSRRGLILLSAKFPDEGVASTNVVFFDAEAAGDWGASRWEHGATDACSLSAGPDGQRAFCVLSDHGIVSISNRFGIWAEQIPRAGLAVPKARGYMSSIREVGGRLYACGAAGQLYHRVGADTWRETLPDVTAEEDARRDGRVQRMLSGRFDPVADTNDIRASRDFFGLYEGDAGQILIAGGFGLVARVTEGAYQETRVDDRTQIVWVSQAEKIVTAVGWKDARTTVFRGVLGSGLTPIARSTEVGNATSATLYRGILFIGSKVGLFAVHDGEVERIARGQVTGVSQLDTVDDVLWVIGHHDVFRMEGDALQRFEQPQQ